MPSSRGRRARFGAGHPFDTEDIEFILKLAGRMPFLLQKAALILYKLYAAGINGEAGRLRLADDFKADIQAHFKSQIDQFLDNEKDILFQLARRKSHKGDPRVLKQMENYGLIEKTSNRYKILGQAFETCLRETPAPTA